MRKDSSAPFSQTFAKIRRLSLAAILAAFWLSPPSIFDAGAQSVAVSLAPKPGGLPGDLRMSWTGVPNNTYLVQTATNLNGPNNWQTFDAVTATNNSVIYDISPGADAQTDLTRFYRLILPQPQILSVEPALVSSSDPNAVLYLLGQMLPANATVVINGQDYTPTIINANGVWASVSLTNLPPGTVITGQISVIDNALGTAVATLAVQNPIIYGTTLSNEQLQGPPGEPPASPRGLAGDVIVIDDTSSQPRLNAFVAVPDRANGRFASADPADGNGDGGGRGDDSSAVSLQLATGEFQETDMDLAVAGRGLDFAWVRTYRSRTGPTTAQGVRWDFSYDVTLAVQGNGTVALTTGDGRTETFYTNGVNSWARNEYFVQVGDLNGDGFPDVLFPDGGKWLFNPTGPAAGKLASIEDANGNVVTLGYDTSGRLTTIVDTLGRINTVSYNSGGMIASVTDFSGRTVTYTYDSNNNLVQCVSPPVTGTPNGNDFPGGKTNTYAYSSGFANDQLNHNLTIVTHEMGHNWNVAYQPDTDPTALDFDAVASVSYGPYTEQLTRYAQTPSPANGFAAVEAIFCDAVGNVSECYFDSHLRCVQELDYTGRSNPAQPVTQTGNRPTGQLRSTDPVSYETLWTWNPDSLCSSITENPQSLSRQETYLHERDLNRAVTAIKKGDLRVIDDLPSGAVDTTGDGSTDTTARSWHFTYDPRFGSPDKRDGNETFASLLMPALMKSKDKATAGHTPNMIGNHKDCMTTDGHEPNAVGNHKDCMVAAAHEPHMTGNHKDCMVAADPNHNDGNETFASLIMPALLRARDKSIAAPDHHGGGTSTPLCGQYLRKKLPGRMKSGVVTLTRALPMTGAIQMDRTFRPGRPGLSAAGDMDGIFTPTGSGNEGSAVGLYCRRKMPGRMKSGTLQIANSQNGDTDGNGGLDRLAFAQDTDGNGGLDRLEAALGGTTLGDGAGRLNRARMAFGDLNGDGIPDFCVSATDPDGNITTASYDAAGNTLQWHLEIRVQRVQMDLAYNPHGQVTYITNVADANGYTAVDAFNYYSSGPQTGYLQSWTEDAAGLALTTSYEYDARGNVTRTVDPRGNDCLFTYNALDQLVQSQSPTNITARATCQFYYDTNDNLVQVSTELLDNQDNPEHAVTNSYTYDPLNRCASIVIAGDTSHDLTFGLAYDGNGNTTAVYSPMAMSGADPNSFVSFQYDERDLLFREADAPLNPETALTNEWDYDVNGNCIQVTASGAAGTPEVTGLAYDGFERCVSVQDAQGNVVTAAYDRCDNPVIDRFYQPAGGAAGNQLLAQTSYQYDQLYRPVVIQEAFFNAAGNSIGKGYAQTSFAYAPNGELLAVTDNNQHTTSYSYDTDGRCVRITDPLNDTVQFGYDPNDNVTNVFLTNVPNSGIGTPSYFSLTATYDSQNRRRSRTDNSGNTCAWAYDSLDRLVQQTDANGHLTGAIYDDLGRCTATLADLNGDGVLDFALDAKSVFTWDDNSRCVARADANTNTTLYAYDSLGRCLAITNADTTVSQFTYDCFGNLITSADPNGTTVTNHYDRIHGLIHRDIACRNLVVASTTFENFAYDGLLRVVSVSNNISGSTFTYDSLGDCASSTQDGMTTTATYDGVGNLLSLTYPSGRSVTYSYDALDEPVSISSGASGAGPSLLATFTYAGPGRLATISRANLTSTQFTWDGQVSPANPAGDSGWGEVASITHTASGGKTLIDGRQYTYDHNQNLISREQVAPFTTGGPTLTNFFAYDAVNRMTNFAHLSGLPEDYMVQYALDGDGNRTGAFSGGLFAAYTLNNVIPPGDSEMNRYTQTPFGSQSYDANGNLTGFSSTGKSWSYKYDYANRLVEVDDLLAGTTVATFGYDALGRRIGETNYNVYPPVEVSTEFAVLRERFAIAEQYQSGGPLFRSWACADGLHIRGQDGANLLASIAPNGTPTYYHTDQIGNVIALTDPQGNVLERTDYGDFGQPTFLAADGSVLTGTTGQPLTSSSHGNPFLFHGMYWDGETGLYSTSANVGPVRWMAPEAIAKPAGYLDPLTGRFIESAPGLGDQPFVDGDPDRPLVIFSGGNRYTFSGGNPWSAAPPPVSLPSHNPLTRPAY